MRSEPAHDFNGADAVRDVQHFLRIDVVLFRPAAPLASDRASRVHEDSVEVEQNCCAVKSIHEGFSLRTLRSPWRPLRSRAFTAKCAKESAKAAKKFSGWQSFRCVGHYD